MAGGGSGFTNYQNSNPANTQATVNTVYGAGYASFPSSTATVPYPGLSQKELQYEVPQPNPNAGLPAGVARDYKGAMPAVTPVTIQQMLDNLTSLAQSNPDAVAKLQDSLILGGYLDPRSRSYTPGGVVSPGDATWDAYAHLLLDSVRSQQDFQDLLNTRISNKAGEQKFNMQTVDTTVHVTNTQDAKITLANVMEQDLGRKPTNAEISAFAAQLAGDEQSNPETTVTQYDLHSFLNKAQGGPTKGATTTTSGGVNPDAEAQSFDMSQNSGEMAQAQGDNIYQLFLSMLNGAGSAA